MVETQMKTGKGKYWWAGDGQTEPPKMQENLDELAFLAETAGAIPVSKSVKIFIFRITEPRLLEKLLK